MRSADGAPGGSGRPRELVLICSSIGTSFISQSMLMLAVPLFALELGATVATVGLLVSLPFWVPAIVAIPIGRIVSHVGARRMMLAGGIGMIIAPWITVLAPSMFGLMSTQVLLGVAHVMIGIAAQTTVATIGRGSVLERSFGWYATSASSGQLLGPVLAGLLFDQFGGIFVFALAGSIGVLTVIATTFLTVSAQTPVGSRRSFFGYREQVQLVRRNAGLQMVLVVTVSTLFGFAAYAAFFPVYLEGLAVPATLIGGLMGVQAICSTAVRPFVPFLVRVMGGRSRTILACISLSALSLGLIGLTQHLGALALLSACLGMAFGAAQPLTMVAVADHVDAEDRPAAYGFRTTSNQVAQVTAPLALGALGQLAGLPTMFVCAGLALIALGCVVHRMRPTFDALEVHRLDLAASRIEVRR